MNRTLAAFVAALTVFCICDFVWLGVLARTYYQTQLGALMLDQPKWIAAAIFYPLYCIGIVIFCVEPALANGSWTRALKRGALLGLVAYSTYDLSNLATLKGWPVGIVVVDVAWGMFASGIAAVAGFIAARVATRG